MAKKILTMLILTLLLSALMVASSVAKATFDTRTKADRRAQKVIKYSLEERSQMTARTAHHPEYLTEKQSALTDSERRIPLGAAGSRGGLGPGAVVDQTWEDDQYIDQGRKVAFEPDYVSTGTVQAYVHFTYDDLETSESNRKVGYNIFDPTDYSATGGGWVQGSDGCEHPLGSDNFARWGTIDVLPTGYAVFSGIGGAAGDISAIDHMVITQVDVNTCMFTNVTYVDTLQYEAFWIGNPADGKYWFHMPQVEVQINGTDTITHVAGTEVDNPLTILPGHLWGEMSLIYFQKVGTVTPPFGQGGTWTQGVCLDTIRGNSYLVSSPYSGKVAVVYHDVTATTEASGGNPLFLDQNILFRENTNYGNAASWGTKDTILWSDEDRSIPSVTSIQAEMSAIYDSEDRLHVVFQGYPVPANPDYHSIVEDGDWSDFISNIYHWVDDGTDDIVKIAHGDYTHDANNKHCGMGGDNYVAFPSVGICDTNLYVYFGRVHSDIIRLQFTDPDWIDSLGVTVGLDCVAEESGTARTSQANWDYFLTVSVNLDGKLWDQPRNLTNTQTPGCNPDGGSQCASEWLGAISRYGFDDGLLTANGANLTWPAAPTFTIDLDPEYTGGKYMHMTYLDDEAPGSWWRDDPEYPTSPFPTHNDYKWFRVPCSGPVAEALISYEPTGVAYPYWIHNGVADTIEVTVHNDGIINLDLTVIDTVETSGSQSGWLYVPTEEILGIEPGDSTTFEIIVNKDGLINNPNQSEFLEGYVYMLNTSSNEDSASVSIQILVADTMMNVVWDTVTTTDPWGSGKAADEFVALTMNNFGGYGHMGEGGVNMDYTDEGGDCDSDAEVYLYDGSFYLIQNIPTVSCNYTISLHNTGFVDDKTWKPLPTTVSSGVTDAYDSVYAGACANWDTSTVIERTFYAPRDHDENPTFVLSKTVMYCPGDTAVGNLTLGSLIDWDIPADDGADNNAGVSIPKLVVYAQGTDTFADPDPDCQLNANRWGAERLLGYYLASEFNVDENHNDTVFYGCWADSFHGWWDDAECLEVWDSIQANPSLSANSGTYDQAIHFTYLNNYTLPANDTLTIYTAYVTVQNGTSKGVVDLENSIQDAIDWYFDTFRFTGCCIGLRGDVDLVGNCTPEEQDTDISDLTNMIDHLFINFTPICCLEEADISPWIKGNPPDGAVDIADLTDLIDHLFINFPPMPTCQYP